MKHTSQSTAVRLLGHLRGQRVRLTVVAVSIVAYVALSIWNPMYSAVVIDHLWQQVQAAWQTGRPFSLTGPLGWELLRLTGQYLLSWVFYYLQAYLMASVAESLVLSLRTQVARKLNRLPLRFFDQNKAGEILSRVTSDLDKVSETLQTGLLKLIVALGTIAGSLIVMFRYSAPLTGVFLAFMAVCMLVTHVVAGKNLRCAAERQETVAVLTGIVEEYYNGRNVIKAYHHEAESIQRVSEAAAANRIANQRADFLTNCVNPLIRLLTRMSQVVIAIVAGRAMLNGTMSVGVVQAFFQYVNQSAEPMTEASYMINSLQSALASAERTFQLLDEEEERPDPLRPRTVEQTRGQVAFEHVRFGYDPAHPVLRDFSVDIPAGSMVAVVGPTGAGKTTLVSLLLRFYTPQKGTITIDGLPLQQYTRDGLRRRLAIVLQDGWLCGGTIAENIAYGVPGATRAQIEAAARAACIHPFLSSLPEGYDTVLTDSGAGLSKGQRQLLALARCFLSDADIVILDEATSDVDPETEEQISAALERLRKGRTCFLIAHRLATVRAADRILVLQDGRIAEQGTHQPLLDAGGIYRSLYDAQFS